MTDRPTKQQAIDAAYDTWAADDTEATAARDVARSIIDAAYHAELACIEQEYPDD